MEEIVVKGRMDIMGSIAGDSGQVPHCQSGAIALISPQALAIKAIES